VKDESGTYALSELQKAGEFLRQNWTDEIGAQYIQWLEHAQEALRQAERHREIVCLKKEKVAAICRDILENGDEDEPKTLRLRL